MKYLSCVATLLVAACSSPASSTCSDSSNLTSSLAHTCGGADAGPPDSAPPGDNGDAGGGPDAGVEAGPDPESVGVDPSLLAYYRFDDLALGKVLDSSGNGHDGTVVGSAKILSGKVKSAMYFDGSTTRVTVGQIADMPTWTIMFWVSSDAVVDARCPFDANFDNFDLGPRFNQSANAGGILGVDYAGTGALAGYMPAHTWHHAALSRDGSSGFRIYFDGALFTTLAKSGATRFGDVVIGDGNENGTNNTHFLGLLDELRIYSRALSTPEIRAIYDAQR